MKNDKKIWVISVNMGYGHQRTAYALKEFALDKKIINSNIYDGIPSRDKNLWQNSRSFYEFVSSFKRVPIIGSFAFYLFDKFQKILHFYPKRDLSKPNLTVKKMFSMIKKGWGEDLILRIKKNPLPMVNTFFPSAFMAESFNYPGEIFCTVCDADISRAWAPLDPQKSRIKYFAPNSWTVERLKLYGVKKENIFLTGYPLPVENIGTKKMEILKKDIGYRMLNIDPEKKYYNIYGPLIDKYVGKLPNKKNHTLTIMFSIGGAGAQKEIAMKFVKNLSKRVKNKELNILLMAGIKRSVNDYFEKSLKELKMHNLKGIEIVFSENIEEYFKKFNEKLRTTDILWTKPSELSFYVALGIPIIIAPPIGSQEDFNKKWLRRLGAGIVQEDPNHAEEWIYDYLKSGRFADASMRGFMGAEKLGTYNIEEICLGW